MKNKFCVIFFLAMSLFAFRLKAQDKRWTLQECVEYALKNNISVRQSELDLNLTEVDKSDAIGRFLPAINMTANHSWNVGLNQNPITGINQVLTTANSTFNASAQTDVYKGLQNQLRFQRSKMAIVASQYQLQKMKDDISLNVANAYLQILFNRENLKVQQQQLETDIKQSERSSELLEGGLIPRGDLLDINATVELDRQKVIQAENQLLISKLSLAQLLQLDDFKTFDIADEDYKKENSVVLSESPQAIFEKAKTTRSEIKLAQANLDLAEADVKIARRAYQPSLSAFYNFNTRASSALPDPFWSQVDDYKGHTYGFQLSIPVFNGFSTRNTVERNKIALERSKLTFDQQNVDLERGVYTAFTDAQGALKAYDAAVSAEEARAQALEYAKERYEVGLINVFDLNQAQTLAVNAQSEVLRTKYDFIFKVKILEFYFGIPIYQKQ
ncbi:TolC family protein [Flavobacterium sp. AG291]|uniref:TolC family protein n=1 Tax=Flavobacterium sp. AG291 TaxID=2184000 RepID=UPI000E0A88E6|nr:TolC family protein [Flavobacterium sp. AG291]RDI15845.1 outer membrane protein [Flavobacterium sp. AG291]